MRTPAGTECSFFYADYHRGRQHEECRLIGRNPDSEAWRPALCRGCPVPRIQLANTCPNLILEGRVKKGLLGLSRRVEISASCIKTTREVAEPMVGCGHCHEYRSLPVATE
ncbi:MAG: hypothetical protein HY784_13835 [Chloroflexi bacterium]|nr:hypothetical protein [Chloroflexota bacterium]